MSNVRSSWPEGGTSPTFMVLEACLRYVYSNISKWSNEEHWRCRITLDKHRPFNLIDLQVTTHPVVWWELEPTTSQTSTCLITGHDHFRKHTGCSNSQMRLTTISFWSWRDWRIKDEFSLKPLNQRIVEPDRIKRWWASLKTQRLACPVMFTGKDNNHWSKSMAL